MGPVAAGGDSKRREKPGIIDVNSILGVRVARVDVEAHRGTITAVNRPEGGSLFTIYLPMDIPA